MNPIPTSLTEVAAFADLAKTADHVDVKTFTSDRSLGEFITRMLCYHPAWLRGLYAVRAVLIRLLGLPKSTAGTPPEHSGAISFTPGDQASFLTVIAAQDPSFWIGGVEDKHLAAYIAVSREATGGTPRFHVATLVRYRHWTGPVYFNCIRPFHHLVVLRMGNRAAG